MISRRLLLTQTLLFITSCTITKSTQTEKLKRLTIGVVAYGEGVRSIEQYQGFIKYLENRTKTLIEVEPVYNEVKAIEQIQRQVWSLVFAPPGLAAIAVSKAQYIPIFPLQGVNNLRSVLVVLKTSPIQNLIDLNGKSVALGQPGSATGYYVPLYNLYGITPSEVRIAPTPKTVLEWIAKVEVTVGALSKDEFDRYRSEFSPTEFRILHSSSRIPTGAVLGSPTLESNQQQSIQQAMNEALPAVAQQAGYIPNAKAPEYETLISFIEKVKPIEARIHEKPAPLYQSEEEKKSS